MRENCFSNGFWNNSLCWLINKPGHFILIVFGNDFISPGSTTHTLTKSTCKNLIFTQGQFLSSGIIVTCIKNDTGTQIDGTRLPLGSDWLNPWPQRVIARKIVGNWENGRFQLVPMFVHDYIFLEFVLIVFISVNHSLPGINATSYNISHDDPCDCSVEINGTLQDQPCTEWQYDDSVFESTLVTQVIDRCHAICNPEPPVTKRMDLLPRGLMKSRSRNIYVLNLTLTEALPRCLPNIRAIRAS